MTGFCVNDDELSGCTIRNKNMKIRWSEKMFSLCKQISNNLDNNITTNNNTLLGD
jgi:hypothetical protein